MDIKEHVAGKGEDRQMIWDDEQRAAIDRAWDAWKRRRPGQSIGWDRLGQWRRGDRYFSNIVTTKFEFMVRCWICGIEHLEKLWFPGIIAETLRRELGL